MAKATISAQPVMLELTGEEASVLKALTGDVESKADDPAAVIHRALLSVGVTTAQRLVNGPILPRLVPRLGLFD